MGQITTREAREARGGCGAMTRVVGCTWDIKAFVYAMSLAHWNLANSRLSVKNIATADVRVMCMPIHIWYHRRCMAVSGHAPVGGVSDAFFHTGVELHVVRSTDKGNARASVRGTTAGKFSTLFFPHDNLLDTHLRLARKTQARNFLANGAYRN